MNTIVKPNLDHSKNSLGKVNKLSFYQMNYVCSWVLFERLTRYVAVKQSFGYELDAPPGYVISKDCLKRESERHLDEDHEKKYLSLIFDDLYYQINKDLADKERSEKANKENKNLERSEQVRKEKEEDVFATAPVNILQKERADIRYAIYLKAIKVIEKSNQNCLKFIEWMCPKDKLVAMQEL